MAGGVFNLLAVVPDVWWVGVKSFEYLHAAAGAGSLLMVNGIVTYTVSISLMALDQAFIDEVRRNLAATHEWLTISMANGRRESAARRSTLVILRLTNHLAKVYRGHGEDIDAAAQGGTYGIRQMEQD